MITSTGGVALEGELDIYTREQLRDVLRSFYETNEPEVQVDVRRLGYIDSVGVEVLLSAKARLRSQRRTLLVHGAQGQVQRMFSVLRMEELLTRL
jgi:anti-anti-sigma factor